MLEIQPVPESSWGKSLAQLLPQPEWDKLRRKCYIEANYICKECLGEPETSMGPMNAHEVWGYDHKKKIQALLEVECLCKTCHDCVHWKRSKLVYSPKYLLLLEKHFLEVNNWTKKDLLNHIERVNKQYLKMRDIPWKIYVGGTRIG